jgi:hypothetical protein
MRCKRCPQQVDRIWGFIYLMPLCLFAGNCNIFCSLVQYLFITTNNTRGRESLYTQAGAVGIPNLRGWIEGDRLSLCVCKITLPWAWDSMSTCRYVAALSYCPEDDSSQGHVRNECRLSSGRLITSPPHRAIGFSWSK